MPSNLGAHEEQKAMKIRQYCLQFHVSESICDSLTKSGHPLHIRIEIGGTQANNGEKGEPAKRCPTTVSLMTRIRAAYSGQTGATGQCHLVSMGSKQAPQEYGLSICIGRASEERPRMQPSAPACDSA